MATYKTKNGQLTGFVPGVGPIVDGFLKNAPDNLENYNLEKIEEPTAQPVTPLSPAPAATAPAAPVASQPATQPQQPTNQETK